MKHLRKIEVVNFIFFRRTQINEEAYMILFESIKKLPKLKEVLIKYDK